MSATGALILTLSAILVLGALAAWLLNLPLWLIGIGLVGGGLLARRIVRRAGRRNHQDTMSP